MLCTTAVNMSYYYSLVWSLGIFTHYNRNSLEALKGTGSCSAQVQLIVTGG